MLSAAVMIGASRVKLYREEVKLQIQPLKGNHSKSMKMTVVILVLDLLNLTHTNNCTYGLSHEIIGNENCLS